MPVFIEKIWSKKSLFFSLFLSDRTQDEHRSGVQCGDESEQKNDDVPSSISSSSTEDEEDIPLAKLIGEYQIQVMQKAQALIRHTNYQILLTQVTQPL